MPIKAKLLGYVFLGGVLGTMLRYLVFLALGSIAAVPTTELIALFVVNLAGTYFLGLTARHPSFQTDSRRSFWGVGFAGSFTTMSALTLWMDSHNIGVEVYVMVAAGLILYWAGFEAGRKKAKADN